MLHQEDEEDEEDEEMDPLNPLRKIDYKSYKLVHRNDGKTAHVKLYDVRTARYYSTIWM